MSTNTATAANLGNAKWVAPCGRVAQFEYPSRAFGIVDAQGRMFSLKGERPSVWKTKAIAAELAQVEQFVASGVWLDPA